MTNYERWLKYYQLGWVSSAQLDTAVTKGLLTAQEKTNILATVV